MVILAMVDYRVYHFTWLFMEYMNAIGTLYSQALFVEFSYPWLFLQFTAEAMADLVR
jgi:hypothetical protein